MVQIPRLAPLARDDRSGAALARDDIRSFRSRALLMVVVAAACSNGKDSSGAQQASTVPTSPALATTAAAVPSSSTLLGRATFVDPKDPMFTVKRLSHDFHVELKAHPGLDVAMQSINFPVGAQSTWHTHPGPVFIIVAQGTMRFYEGDDPHCTPVELTAGHGFLDTGEHAHIARNESGAPAQTVVTYLVPPGAALRKDEPRPGNCPF